MRSIYRKLDATIRNQAITRPANWGFWRAEGPDLLPQRGMKRGPGLR
jgi:hypothetical protein